jgi:phage baseplate assembly protein W
MKPRKKTFLGTGWAFPPTFDKAENTVQMVSDDQDIQQSLFILLSTKQGERVMLPKFGANLQALAFDVLNAATIAYAKSMIEQAILAYEPRITLDELEMEPVFEDGLLNINIVYTIRKTNTRSNMVYPYYLAEGTEVSF